MPVETSTRMLLDQIDASGFPGFANMTVAQAREALLQLRELAGPPESILSEDRVVPGPGGGIPVRLYVPEAVSRPPLVVYFHGGGFVCGSLETIDTPLRALANRSGCAIVSVDYRLGPEHRFPAAVEDAERAVGWAAGHAAELGFSPHLLAVAGDSCGGGLAASVCLLARERGGPPIDLQLLLYPMLDPGCDMPSQHEFGAGGYLITRADLRWFWSHYLRREEDGRDWRAAPLEARDLAGLPPAAVITAEFDPLRDEGEEYARRLSEAGVPVEQIRYDGLIHACFQMAGVVDRCRAVVDDVADLLRRLLAREEALKPATSTRT